MKMILVFFVAAGGFAAGLPREDRRNTDIPGTDTHFKARAYRSLEESDGWGLGKVYIETFPAFSWGKFTDRSGVAAAIRGPGSRSCPVRPLGTALFFKCPLAVSWCQGYAAFGYDMVGHNDTVQMPHVFGGPREQLWSSSWRYNLNPFARSIFSNLPDV
jgi:hypothetical protein